jgi:hypothetical protein
MGWYQTLILTIMGFILTGYNWMLIQDYGPGLTVDDLIGLPAGQISWVSLPKTQIFELVNQAASVLVNAGLESYRLSELWEDGHTTWQSMTDDDPVVVTPSGQIKQKQA